MRGVLLDAEGVLVGDELGGEVLLVGPVHDVEAVGPVAGPLAGAGAVGEDDRLVPFRVVAAEGDDGVVGAARGGAAADGLAHHAQDAADDAEHRVAAEAHRRGEAGLHHRAGPEHDLEAAARALVQEGVGLQADAFENAIIDVELSHHG